MVCVVAGWVRSGGWRCGFATTTNSHISGAAVRCARGDRGTRRHERKGRRVKTMRHSVFVLTVLVLISVVICGCSNAPGRPPVDSASLRPNEVLSFDTLYHQNCAGCHGEQGRGGAAIALNSAIYLEIADDAALRSVTAKGVPGTAMPAFAQSSGGMLTDEQVNAIVAGMRSRWSKHGSLPSALPTYSAAAPG